jgi:hypothetical protein
MTGGRRYRPGRDDSIQQGDELDEPRYEMVAGVGGLER